MRYTILVSVAILLLSVGAQAKNFPVPEMLQGGCKADADCIKIDTSCKSCCEFDAVLKTAKEGYITARSYACGVPTAECKCANNGVDLKPVCVEHRCALINEKMGEK